MKQAKSGRWVPDAEPKPTPPVPLYQRYGIDLSVPLPWWYPLMHFEAAVGRQALRKRS